MKCINPKAILFGFLCCSFNAFAQNYNAIHGSPYAGVSSVFLNPASSVNSFYKWDASLVGVHFTTSQNLFQLNNVNLFNPPTETNDTLVTITNWTRTRFYHNSSGGQALSFRMNLGPDKAFAVSFRGRSYTHVNSSKAYFYHDSTLSLPNFLRQNLSNQPLNFNLVHSGFTELNLNYSQVVSKTNYSKLSAGINIGILKSLSGAQFFAKDITYTRNINPNNGSTYYTLTGGSTGYMFSKNFDDVDTINDQQEKAKQFYKLSQTGLTVSIGAEFLVKNSYDGVELNNRNYDWKIGVSIMDFGFNKYKHANGSATHRIAISGNATDTSFSQQLAQLTGIRQLTDSLATNFSITNNLNSNFNIATPARLVLNIDKNLGNHFYLNASTTINFYTTKAQERGTTKEINFLTLTPRYETQLIGFYLPIQFTHQYNVWLGAALKLGPLVVGIHDISFFKWGKQQTQTMNGGGYLMLNVFGWRNTANDGIDCPKVIP
jgi:hypothetical protein